MEIFVKWGKRRWLEASLYFKIKSRIVKCDWPLNGGEETTIEEREDGQSAFIRYYMDKPERNI